MIPGMSTPAFTTLHVVLSLIGIATGFVVAAKVPALKALAPTQSEPPFVAGQAVVFLAFLVLGVGAFRSFRPSTLERTHP